MEAQQRRAPRWPQSQPLSRPLQVMKYIFSTGRTSQHGGDDAAENELSK